MIERTNRTVIEGTKSLLFQSGLPHKYWPLALKMFCCNYNFAHYDTKRGTNPHVERHGSKFKGKRLIFGQKVRYMSSSKRELDETQKFEPKLRDSLVVGYRMHTGGVWTGQYLVLDAQRYQEVQSDAGHTAYDHGVTEVYVPGTATDDTGKPFQFPVASGLWREAGAATTPDDPADDLRTTETDVLPTSQRPVNGDDHPSNAGGAEADQPTTYDDADITTDMPAVARDYWQIQGDSLVRVHNVPRTTLFAPWMAEDDEPPVPIINLEVSRSTGPVFAGARWPGLDKIEDAWSGHPSDAKPIRHPDDGSTLTWTGETTFYRVLPEPPDGKEWCSGMLIRSRKGSKRAKDVHPLQWWVMSEVARLKASTESKAKLKAMQEAIRKRTLPREPLETMPQRHAMKSNIGI